ncbi:MAG TPA: tetratricopeptide repeat protein [Candidatus Binatia bacterium]|jgi:Flp pilus assembly protein TadD|nr:tetratricopeptide repeat protein [Candidatus Binatia bacterium]
MSQQSTNPSTYQSSKTLALVSVALFLAVLGVFLPTITPVFAGLDDGTYVTSNLHVQAGLSWENLKWAFTTSEASNWHPLTWLSHMLDCQLFGLNARGHHLTSVLLHGMNTVLLFLVLARMTHAARRSLFVAALFGLHPLRVESVAWVAERKDVLSTFFLLLTIWAYVRYVEKSKGQGPKSKVQGLKSTVHGPQSTVHSPNHVPLYYILSLVFFALGLMAKPMLVTLPFVLLLLDYWPLGRLQLSTSNFQLSTLLDKAPFFLLAAGSSAVTYLVQKQAGAMSMIAHLPFSARLENALVAYCRYLGKCFWPVNLSIIYAHPGYWPVGTVVLSVLVLTAISILVLARRRESPYLLVGWLWFLGTLVPAIGLVQVGHQSMADRYTYVPLVGIFIMVTWTGLADAWRRPFSFRVSSCVFVVVLAVCALLTIRQARYWQSSETLFRHAVEVEPSNYLAHGNLGNALQRQGLLSEALAEYRAVLRLKPDDVNTLNGLGSLLMNLGSVDQAIALFQQALRQMPEFAEAHNNLAFALQKQGRLDEAAHEYEAALRTNPDDYRIRLNLAALLLKQGKVEPTIAQLRAALRSRPDDIITRKSLGSLLFNNGRVEEALDQFQEAARTQPNDPEAQANLGIALSKQGRREEAVVHLTHALQLRPDYPEAQAELRALTGGQ